LPAIFVGVRVSLALSLIILLVAEMVGASEGLGFFVIYAERNYETSKMMAGIITIGVLGFGLNALARGLERLVIRYHLEPA
jgi:ABC-type nitrate/sulfonate/bicarbonate transport system permease component